MFVMTLRCRHLTGGGRLMAMMEYIYGSIQLHRRTPQCACARQYYNVYIQQLPQYDDGRCSAAVVDGPMWYSLTRALQQQHVVGGFCISWPFGQEWDHIDDSMHDEGTRVCTICT